MREVDCTLIDCTRSTLKSNGLPPCKKIGVIRESEQQYPIWKITCKLTFSRNSSSLLRSSRTSYSCLKFVYRKVSGIHQKRKVKNNMVVDVPQLLLSFLYGHTARGSFCVSAQTTFNNSSHRARLSIHLTTEAGFARTSLQAHFLRTPSHQTSMTSSQIRKTQ